MRRGNAKDEEKVFDREHSFCFELDILMYSTDHVLQMFNFPHVSLRLLKTLTVGGPGNQVTRTGAGPGNISR